MKPKKQRTSNRAQNVTAEPQTVTKHSGTFILLVAALAGFCTMAYEIIWSRILKYFVDNSIHSFAIILATFLTGLTLGGFVLSRFADSRKRPLLFLALLEIGIGFLCLVSIPVIARLDVLIGTLNAVLGSGFVAEVSIRFLVFSAAILLPTFLMGGAFPVIAKLYTRNVTDVSASLGKVYGVNTVGGVLGSFAGGFLFLPFAGVQYSLALVCGINILIGVGCLWSGAKQKAGARLAWSAGVILVPAVLLCSLPPNAFLRVYQANYPAPQNRLLYLKENINGTATVFQNTRQPDQKYMIIDGTGEVSTDYLSMRAFRLLGLLPSVYLSDVRQALVVTFGSGIAAGTIAALPGMERVECVEICKEAFNAASHFSFENHDVLNNEKIRFIVNDGRNYVFTTRKRYDIISADATHPTSADSWIMYTREFYDICKSKLTEKGVMCQWIPLHGLLEADFNIILNTFHAAFPYVGLWYSGGYKTIGHTVLVGSNAPLSIDHGHVEALFSDSRIREDLARVNIFTPFDLYGCYLMDQDSLASYAGKTALNSDDKPIIIFSKPRVAENPYVSIGAMAPFRENVNAALHCPDSTKCAQVRMASDNVFRSMTHAMSGLAIGFREYAERTAVSPDQPPQALMPHLMKSKALYEQILGQYETALQINGSDFHARYLFARASQEYQSLLAVMGAIARGAALPTD